MLRPITVPTRFNGRMTNKQMLATATCDIQWGFTNKYYSINRKITSNNTHYYTICEISPTTKCKLHAKDF